MNSFQPSLIIKDQIELFANEGDEMNKFQASFQTCIRCLSQHKDDIFDLKERWNHY